MFNNQHTNSSSSHRRRNRHKHRLRKALHGITQSSRSQTNLKNDRLLSLNTMNMSGTFTPGRLSHGVKIPPPQANPTESRTNPHIKCNNPFLRIKSPIILGH